ncbi:MAG: sulfotransferase domain-containing protein [Caldilinea sp. CFX5]|nr:sulfotransferase domain-containing protein [Caldilinea sp. CFX5]
MMMTATPPTLSYAPEDVMRRYRHLRTVYGERDSDIYISTYTRSGTTWMQLILYQLTTDGNMAFKQLFDVSPWLFYNALRGTEPVQRPEPRILKTHDDYDFYPANTKGRFIYVIRDGRDVLVSFYHHRVNAKGFTGTFADHFHEFIYGMKYNGLDYNWFEHVKAWVENKNKLPVMYVQYESLQKDFDNTIKRIARLCDIPITEAILTRTRDRTSFAFMKAYELKLGPTSGMFKATEDAPYKVKNETQFIRQGKIGEGQLVLTPEQKEIYRQKFHEVLGHIDFLADYGK